MKTVALKDPNSGSFTMCRLTGFGTISSDDREQYGTRVSLGNVKTSLDLKETRIVTLEDDKLVKDSKISALEDDKAVKDTKIANLESDKNDKDNRVAALETDKNEKDTKMSDMESDMALLASQVSLGNIRVSLGNLANRVTSLETLGISGISNAVSWTNLTEINLSGEKLTNGDFSSVTNNAPTNWSVTNGTLNQSKLAQGIIRGLGGAVAIQQSLSQNIASGTALIIKVESDDDIKLFPIKTSGQTDNDNPVIILSNAGYAEYTTQTVVSGFKVSTINGIREFSSISIFQGAISGGTVQAYAGGGLEKISGTNGWNAGASSSQKIEGNSDGYVQFQWSSDSVRVGLKYSDTDFDVDSPYLEIDSTTNTVGTKSVAPGDWFRIRHYASTNEIKYQRKETVEEVGQDYVTFYTEPTLTNGNDLYIDVSLYHVGARINDVTIVR